MHIRSCCCLSPSGRPTTKKPSKTRSLSSKTKASRPRRTLQPGAKRMATSRFVTSWTTPNTRSQMVLTSNAVLRTPRAPRSPFRRATPCVPPDTHTTARAKCGSTILWCLTAKTATRSSLARTTLWTTRRARARARFTGTG
ncbi:hypothetical protein L917_07279 [Phytophthora nicotianae]|uniref:Uncharacterized protein n=1 Tax=Phytophthora nicotianae TaxID=4792 RepID=W2LBR7_PHYNI|nr:hypothetical protein L917_07279 [Phytophthora nicotianae]